MRPGSSVSPAQRPKTVCGPTDGRSRARQLLLLERRTPALPRNPLGPGTVCLLADEKTGSLTLPIVPVCPGASPARTAASLRLGLGPSARSLLLVRAPWPLLESLVNTRKSRL